MLRINIQVIGNEDTWIKHPTYDNAIINEDCGLDIPMNNSFVIPAKSKAFSIKLGIKCESTHGFMLIPRRASL